MLAQFPVDITQFLVTYTLTRNVWNATYSAISGTYPRWRSQGPASVSRPASRPNFNGLGLGLGLGCPCLGLGLGLGGPGFVYRVLRTGRLET